MTKTKRSSLEQLYEKAKKYANIKCSKKEDANDFATWVTVKYLENKSQHQTLQQSFIDFLRAEHFSSDALQRPRDEYTSPRSHEFIGADDIKPYIKYCSNEEKCILNLKFVWGFSNVEIAQCFDAHESEVSLTIKKLLETILKQIKGELVL